MNKLILENTEDLREYDFSSLRANPIYQVDEYNYRIIYDLFVFEMLHKGLYFKLSTLNNQLPDSQKIKDFRSYYCNDFSENFILYSTIKRMFGSKYKQFSGNQILSYGYNAEPDYYLRNGNKVFLFESKDVLVKAEDKVSFDFKTLENVFRKKFYYDTRSNGVIENKAILQLIFNIERVLNQQFDFDQSYSPLNLKIYPILITHHHQYDVLGLNNLLQVWFEKELLRLKSERYNVKNIKPITLINIDDLIFHQDQFRSKKVKLEEAIDSYHCYVSFDDSRAYRNQEEKKIYIERTYIPFSTFFTGYVANKSQIKAPSIVMEQGIKLFN